MAARLTGADRVYYLLTGLFALLGVTILIGPVLVVLLTSFSTSQALQFPPPGLSLKWYEALLDPLKSGHIHTAIWNSVKVATMATILASVAAVLGALSIAKLNTPAARILEAGFLSPLIFPTLSYGLAVLMFFSLMGFRPSLSLLVIGHVVVIAPFIFRTTLASLTQLEPSLLECSASLGANRWQTFAWVTLPVVAPGILAGAFLAFVSSLDNVPVSLFLTNARTDMLPIRMWGMIESTLDVRVAAISGCLILLVLICLLALDRTVGLTRRM